MDQLNKLKTDLLAELNVQYKNLVQFMRNVPIGDKFKEYSFLNFDQGLMWVEKGIHLIQVETQVPTPPPVSKPEVVDEIEIDPEKLN